MEKLIELLNEWERERVNHNTKEFIPYDRNSELLAELIISKNYGFIKWLVENDKIDLVKFSDKLSNSNGTMEDRYRYLNSDFGLYHTLLMLLSISDEQIDFLISILK